MIARKMTKGLERSESLRESVKVDYVELIDTCSNILDLIVPETSQRSKFFGLGPLVYGHSATTCYSQPICKATTYLSDFDFTVLTFFSENNKST